MILGRSWAYCSGLWTQKVLYSTILWAQKLNLPKITSHNSQAHRPQRRALIDRSIPIPMEFIDEDSRPRVLFQSRHVSSSTPGPQTPTKPSKLHLVSCFSISILLLLSLFLSSSPLLHSQTVSFLLVWTSLSLLLAPFAPSSVTGGDPSVGSGDPLPPPPPSPDLPDPVPSRRPRYRKPDNPLPILTKTQDPIPIPIRKDNGSHMKLDDVVEAEWTDEDFEILKKQISKHPVGEPRRWEKIAEAFGRRHGVEMVIKMGKSMGERRPEDKDAFAQFLKQRKPLDKRVENSGEDDDAVEGKESGKWSSGEDIALLNALKAFPKDVAMRWEKVAAAVPGRTKAECMKRVAELKKGFRSSKASES